MRVLIVVPDRNLATIWARHLERAGATVFVAFCQEDAITTLCEVDVDIIVLNTALEQSESPAAVADFAGYRQPRAQIIFVSSAQFFSEGNLFQHFPNARAMMPARTPPEDLAALVEYYSLSGAA